MLDARVARVRGSRQQGSPDAESMESTGVRKFENSLHELKS